MERDVESDPRTSSMHGERERLKELLADKTFSSQLNEFSRLLCGYRYQRDEGYCPCETTREEQIHGIHLHMVDRGDYTIEQIPDGCGKSEYIVRPVASRIMVDPRDYSIDWRLDGSGARRYIVRPNGDRMHIIRCDEDDTDKKITCSSDVEQNTM
jgi:hypothetical protein